MANNRRKYFRRTRRSRMRDLKHSKNGWIACVFGILAFIFAIVSIIRSFQHSGEAGFQVGSLGLFGLIFAAGALVIGILSMRERNVRPMPRKTGVILGAVFTVVLGGMYIYGIGV